MDSSQGRTAVEGGPRTLRSNAAADAARGSRYTLVDAGGVVLDNASPDDIEKRLRAGTLFWLDVHGPSAEDIDTLGRLFSFHPLALEDSRSFGQRPKIDRYDDYSLLVVFGATEDSDGLVEVHCFSAEHYLVTVRRDTCPAFVELHRRYMARPDSLADQTMLLYHVVDGLTDSFFPSLAEMDEEIDDLQDAIFAKPHESQLQAVFEMKRRLVGLRRVITPERDMFAQLLTDVAVLPGMTDESVRYFRDVYDHLIRLSDMVDTYRDLLTGLFDIYLSNVANRRDQIIKQLTVLATIFLPITFITGYFGQNFGYMVNDLIRSRLAFVVGTGLQVATVVAILAFFKRREWI
jgi:magnesium transporter